MFLINKFVKIKCLFIFSLFFSTFSFAEKIEINRIIVFGDSLSETGNVLKRSKGILPSRINYWEGRFTNGFAWVDYLAQEFETTVSDNSFIINQSVGASTAYPYSADAAVNVLNTSLKLSIDTPSRFFKDLKLANLSTFAYEVDVFNQKHGLLNDKDLVIIWYGANDILWVAEETNENIDGDIIALNAVLNINLSIQKLVKRGARNIIVAGLPEFQLLPRFIHKPNPLKNSYSNSFNTLLFQMVNDLKKEIGLNIIFADVNDIFKSYLLPHYQEFGFLNITDRSFIGSKINLQPELFDFQHKLRLHSKRGNTSHAFWDEVHPSTKTHSIISAMLLKKYVEPNFLIQKPSHSCQYVELVNNGAYIVDVKIINSDDNHYCGKTSSKLSIGKKKIYSVGVGAKITLQARLGRTKSIIVPKILNQYNSYSMPLELKTPIPSLLNITCSGTTLVNFNCLVL